MHHDIENLRQSLPERLTLSVYCDITGRSRSAAYIDLRKIPGLGIKVGPNTFIVRDVMLAELDKPPEPWVPLKDRQQPKAQRRTRTAKLASRKHAER